jgi:tRNA nucleotidyltransferase/poly(A) polymerase
MPHLSSWLSRQCRYAQGQPPKISLTPLEQAIFRVLLEVNAHFKLGTTMRVAGGWVRDKLMGKESDDIDVALDNMTGAQFGKYVLEYGVLHPESKVGKDYTVPMNVEHSKHLETTAVEIQGEKIDLVNLRSEEYGDSRIPTMKMGTPQVDAERRDLTINAIFFNINTGSIEDYIGGVADLQQGLLRTPLDAKKTFKDDPLRMLRVARFKSKYPNFQVAPEILQAMSDPEVQADYGKVKPNRASPEILKMMGGNDPSAGARMLFETGLYRAVFDTPLAAQVGPLDVSQRNPHHKHTILEHTLLVLKNMNELMKEEGVPDDKRKLMNLAALFHDFGKAFPGVAQPKPENPGEYRYHGHEEQSASIADEALKRIGVGDEDREFIGKVVGLHGKAHYGDWSPKAMRRFLREDATVKGKEDKYKDLWRFIMYHGIADATSTGVGDPKAEEQRIRDTMGKFEQIRSESPAVVKKPLLNGNELISMFPGLDPKTGFITDISSRLLNEQDANPLMTKAEAIAFVQGISQEIRSKYDPEKRASSWSPRYNRPREARWAKTSLPTQPTSAGLAGPAMASSSLA